MPSNMDLFSKLSIDFESQSWKYNWVRTIWYVFSQIYTCESIVTESFQPFHSEIPGMQQVSGTDGFFQPRPLKDIYADYLYKKHGNFWQMGLTVDGKKSVTSIFEFVERRQVTGNARTWWILCFLDIWQLNRYIPRILGSGNSGRMLCFGFSLTIGELTFVFMSIQICILKYQCSTGQCCIG